MDPDQDVESGVFLAPKERREMQKKTFTRWMNVFLHRCQPPVCVFDLFTDIQDGKVLMALLEELSGCKLLYRFRSSTHRIFRLSNISKALAFLDDRHVKLLGIDASGIADGVPDVVLHLIWNVILHFQIKEVTAGLRRRVSLSLSSLSVTNTSFPSCDDLTIKENNNNSRLSCSTLPREGRRSKYHRKELRTLLLWVQRRTSKFGVDVCDFGSSWSSGRSFLALIKSINPDLVDLRLALTGDATENMQRAFKIAHLSLDITPLLEPEDVINISDQKSIVTYVSMFLQRDLAKEQDNNSNNFQVTAEIPHFRFLESVTYGETLSDDPEAQAFLKNMKTCSEQRLWKRWSKRVETSHPNQSSGPLSARTSFSKQKTVKGEGVLQPPSPLDAVVDSLEMQSWMETDVKQREYGMCLDSDEEDAYSYILHLEPNYQPKMVKIAKIEEETASEMIEELKTSEKVESSQVLDCEWKLKNLMDDNGGLDLESEEEVLDDDDDDDELQSDDDWGNDDEERGEWKIGNVRFGTDESEKMDEGVCGRRDVEESCELMEEGEKQQDKVMRREEDIKTSRMKSVGEQKEHQQRGTPGSIDLETHKRSKSLDEERNGGKVVGSENRDSDETLSSRTELTLQSLFSVCDVTPVELELLFVLWIVVYCCLILYPSY